MRLIDLSQNIESGMSVYPGDSDIKLTQTHLFTSDKYNNYMLETGMHVGTHVDGPMHLTESNKYIYEYGLENFCGAACILSSQNESIITLKEDYSKIIKGKSIVLIHTGMDRFYGTEKYYSEHPILDTALCEFFVNNNVKMVGIDMPSPDRFPFSIHKYLLREGIFILENLKNIDKISNNNNFEVMAFPLKIKSDSSIVRAVAKVY